MTGRAYRNRRKANIKRKGNPLTAARKKRRQLLRMFTFNAVKEKEE